MKTELSNPRRKDNAAVRVSATNSKKGEYDGQFLGHSKPAEVPETDKANFAGRDSRVLVHESAGPDGGATVHSQAHLAEGQSPHRIRYSEPKKITEHGTTRLAHVTNAAPKKVR